MKTRAPATGSALPPVRLERYTDVAGHREAVARLLEESPAPVFVCQSSIVRDRWAALDRSLAAGWTGHAIAYSFKTNYPVARSDLLRRRGVWAEVVSGREYEMARGLGDPGERIVFNGPYKTDEELGRALADGAAINLNDAEELGRLKALVAGGAQPREVGIRVSSNRLGLARPTRFGFSLDDGGAAAAVRAIRECRGLELAGLHMHLLGDTDDVEIYRRASRMLGSFCRDHVSGPLRYVDMGGGFPAGNPKPRSRASWDPRPIEHYVAAITGELAAFFPGDDRPLLILEPGRYLVCDAISLMTKVIRALEENGRQVLVANGAITMLPLIHYCPQIVRAFSPVLREREGDDLPTIVYGSSCREDDVLYEGPLARVEVEDYLVHYAAGAYNSNLSPGFIFKTPPVRFF